MDFMRYAVVDTGSNTIRLGIFEYENGGLTQLYNEAVFANLAGYIEDGALSSAGIHAAIDAMNQHKKAAQEYGCDLNVFATAAIRNAKNTAQICSEIEKHTGLAVDVLTGEEEADFSFLGASEDFPCTDGVMADVGGGSSEIILFSEKSPSATLSVPWGSLKAFKAFVGEGLPDNAKIKDIQNAIIDTLRTKKEFCGAKKETLCIVGGGVRASKKLATALLENSELSVSAINALLDIILKNPAFARTVIEKVAPKRADTIAPALAIYAAVGQFFGASAVAVSDKGIKEGYVLKKLICK